MKRLVPLTTAVGALAIGATSIAADLRSDLVVMFDTTSIADINIDGIPPAQLPVVAGSPVLVRLDSTSCTGAGCTADLNYLRVTVQDLPLSIDISVAGSTHNATVTLAHPTIAIMGPVTMTNAGSGFFVPVGTPVSVTSNLSGQVDLGSGSEPIPDQVAGHLGALTQPLFIDVGVSPQVLTIDGTFPFSFDASGVIEGHNVSFNMSGSIAVLGSGKTPFANAPPHAVATAGTPDGCGQVMVNASQSTDPNNNIATYQWLNAGGTVVGTGVSTTLTLPAGSQTVTLVVTDTLGAQDRTSITVQMPAEPPPVITQPKDVAFNTCGALTLTPPTATSSCESPVAFTNDAPAFFRAGVTVVTWTGTTPSGAKATVKQRVTAALVDDPACCPVGTNVIVGTAGADVLTGTDGADCILGLAGNDRIDGRGGDDFISGGAGSDTIVGGAGNDFIWGRDGDDVIDGQTGDDFIDGGNGTDTCSGGTGSDAIGNCEVVAFCTAACCSDSSCATSGPGGSSGGGCPAAFAQGNCLSYVQGTRVSRNGHAWECTNGNCANCATFASCEPGASGCPWGVVWTDRGACQ